MSQETIQLISISIVTIFIGFLIFKRLKNLFNGFRLFFFWLKPSFEDTNHQASSRRLTAFSVLVTYICCRVAFAYSIKDPYYLLAALIVDALFILLLFGIVTFQQVINFKETFKNSSSKPIDNLQQPPLDDDPTKNPPL